MSPLAKLNPPARRASHVDGEKMHRELATSELESFPSLDWSDIAPSLTTPVRSSLEKVLETQHGDALSLQDSYTLANSGADDLLGLLVAANLLRAELVGNIVTYVVNRNIKDRKSVV